MVVEPHRTDKMVCLQNEFKLQTNWCPTPSQVVPHFPDDSGLPFLLLPDSFAISFRSARTLFLPSEPWIFRGSLPGAPSETSERASAALAGQLGGASSASFSGLMDYLLDRSGGSSWGWRGFWTTLGVKD